MVTVPASLPQAFEFACKSAACAPPPVGTGGSSGGGGSAPMTAERSAKIGWERYRKMLIPIKGEVKVKSGVAHLDGKPITGRITKQHTTGIWMGRVKNAERTVLSGMTQTEVARNAARMIEGSI